MDRNLKKQTAVVYFGAGCFWGVEDYFSHVNGVVQTEVGYMGGHIENPTYSEVCTDTTGHAEVVKIVFDEKKILFEELLTHFFKIHDPTTQNRQGPDVGSQYRSVILFTDVKQGDFAKEKIESLNKSKKYSNPIVTEVVDAQKFYRAEKYHQKYVEKNGIGACRIQP